MQYIQRSLFPGLLAHLDKPEFSLILGPRQAGKTTLMRMLAAELDKKGRPHATFNLDVVEDAQHFVSQHALAAEVRRRIGDTNAVVFIDEAQRLPNAGLFFKGLYDLGTGCKYVISGSGSLELKANIIEPLTGRKRVFLCLPLSFTEYAAHRLSLPIVKTEEPLAANTYERNRIIAEYMRYGGYPRVALAVTHSEKTEALTEIFRSYLEKDVQLLLGIEKSAAFETLVRLIANQVGGIVNRAELAASVGINQRTIEKYLWVLEKTFVVRMVRPYYTNARKELRKSPKIYFLDLGFLHLAKSAGGQTSGDMFENACFLRLMELETAEAIRYWRSVGGAEVDFILPSQNDGMLTPVEAKLGARVGLVGKSMLSFFASYHPKKAYVYTKDTEGTINRAGTDIVYLPYYRMLQIA